MSTQEEKWSHTEGERPNTVTVSERRRGGPVYVKVWDSGAGKYVRRSLKFKVRDEDGDLIPEAVEKAETYAMEQALKRKKGRGEPWTDTVTLAKVFAEYERRRTPKKSERVQAADRRCIEMWTRLLGADTDPHDVGLDEWENALEPRKSGRVDARGNSVPEGERSPVGNRVVEKDGRWLHAVFRWASRHRWKRGPRKGEEIMRENPVAGLTDEDHLPREKNPTNDPISQERHEAMLSVAPEIRMEIRWGGKRQRVPSYLRELLVIANGTGRRIGSIVSLRVEDLNLERTEAYPFGHITWRAENDKEGYDWPDVPIDKAVREALESALRRRRGLGRVGTGPLFPSATDPDEAITKDIACRWFRRAEQHEEFKLDPMPPNRTWHGYRAKFARETKHLPDEDRAAVGGWKSTATLRRVYDGPDEETMLRVVTERGELREAQ